MLCWRSFLATAPPSATRRPGKPFLSRLAGKDEVAYSAVKERLLGMGLGP